MKDVKINPIEYNLKLAQAIKESGDFAKPDWIDYVKTGSGKVRPNEDTEFWYKRAASILRQAYVRKVVGVGRLRTRYGNRKNKGMKPAKFYKSSGKIVRMILQQAEAAGLMEKVKGKRAGRQLTVKGKNFVESIN